VVAVHLKAGADPNMVASSHGFLNMGRVGGLEDVYSFQRKARLSRSVLKSLDSHSDVLFQERQVLRKRYARDLESIHDPLWNHQWDLHGSSIAIRPHYVWHEMNITGKGVTVSIVDDGLDHRHPDLAPNYNAAASRDINYNKADPTPFAYDSHGTAAGYNYFFVDFCFVLFSFSLLFFRWLCLGGSESVLWCRSGSAVQDLRHSSDCQGHVRLD
jgi:hypothetical protein